MRRQGQRHLEETLTDFVTCSLAFMMLLVVEQCICFMQFHMVGPHKASSGAQGMPHWWYS